MWRLVLKGLKWTGLGALFGLGTSAVSGGGTAGSITGGISSFLNSALLFGLGFLFIYIIFKLYKK